MRITSVVLTGGGVDEPVNVFGNFYERDDIFIHPNASHYYYRGVGYNVGIGIKVKGEF